MFPLNITYKGKKLFGTLHKFIPQRGDQIDLFVSSLKKGVFILHLEVKSVTHTLSASYVDFSLDDLSRVQGYDPVIIVEVIGRDEEATTILQNVSTL